MSDAGRALLLAYDFPPMGGGIARALGELARHAPPGSLTVSTGQQPGAEAADRALDALVDRLPIGSDELRRLGGLARWAMRARHLARADRADFIWAGNLKPAGHVARWLGRRDRLPYGLIVYGLDLNRLRLQCDRSAMKRRLARGIMAEASGTVAISEWVAGRYRSLAGALGLDGAAERVVTIPLGVDAVRFHPGAAVPAQLARVPSGPRRMITVARLVPHKGIDDALRVVAGLVGRGADVEYLVAGTGAERGALERLAEALGIAPRVRWLGNVAEAELPGLYASADLYLGLSREEGPEVEGFGLALLEAQASGLPVVAGRGGGTGEAVADGLTGMLIAAGDLPAGVEAAHALLDDPARARAMGRAGRERAERQFGWARVAADFGAAAERFRREPAGAARGGR